MAYLLISGLFLTRLRRPIGKMTVIEQKYEGEYRYVNSRLITNRWCSRAQRWIFYYTFCCHKISAFKIHLHFTMIFLSEEIAFYNGNNREKQTIHSTFKKLVRTTTAFIILSQILRTWNDLLNCKSIMFFTLRLTTCTTSYFSASPWAWSTASLLNVG